MAAYWVRAELLSTTLGIHVMTSEMTTTTAPIIVSFPSFREANIVIMAFYTHEDNRTEEAKNEQ